MAETLKRNILIVNLDPAAENNKYKCDIGKEFVIKIFKISLLLMM
jgi:hypothetical protein